MIGAPNQPFFNPRWHESIMGGIYTAASVIAMMFTTDWWFAVALIAFIVCTCATTFSIVAAARDWTPGQRDDAFETIIRWCFFGAIGIGVLIAAIGALTTAPGWAVIIIVLLVILVLKKT